MRPRRAWPRLRGLSLVRYWHGRASLTMGGACYAETSTGPPRMPPTELLREHLAQANRHIAELKDQIERQRQLLGGLKVQAAYTKMRCSCSQSLKTPCGFQSSTAS